MQCGQWLRIGQQTHRSWSQAWVGADGDLWEVMDLLLERMEGKVGVPLGEKTRGQENSEENDEQASERECQG